jgi:3-dehydroquinate dehydratase-2
MKKILIINGPNLNLLGKREPEIYGKRSFTDFITELKDKFADIQLDYYQTNHEGDIIDKLQEADVVYDGIVLNPAAYTHTSIAIGDCVKAIEIPVIEVHISDITKREDFRKISYISDAAVKVIAGQGLKGYEMGISFLLKHMNEL